MINFVSEVPTFTFSRVVGWIFLMIFLRLVTKRIYNAFVSPLRLISGPKFCSMSDWSMIMKRTEGRLFEWFYQLHRDYGNVVRVGPKFVIFSSKDAVKQIVTSELPKIDSIAGIRSDPNFATLFSATDRVFHKQRRNLLSPAFSIKYIASLEPLMQSCVKVLVNKFNKLSSQNDPIQLNENGLPIVNLYQLIQATSLDIIGETSMGGSFNLVEDGQHPLPEKVFLELKQRVTRFVFPYLRPILKRDLWMEEFTRKIVRERKELNAQGIKREDILQILLDTRDEEANEGLSEFEIQDQIMEFVVAGSDTTSFTINMTMIMLLHHPEKLCHLMKELESAFPVESRQSPEHKILKNLDYLNATINEVLRLFPVSMGGILRQTTDDMIIDGYLVPKDTVVSASIYQVHHSKEIWGSNADQFAPERWINGDLIELKKNFYTFGAGSRYCIGYNFAMMEIRLVLASLLLNFEFEMVKNQDLQIEQFITPNLRTKKFDVGIRARC